MENKELTFNLEERTIIAEYIFSYQTGVLIKGDALSILDLLFKKEIITKEVYEHLEQDVMNNKTDIADKIARLLSDKIPYEMKNKIMAEYYGG
jgi:hypothetical protein